MKSFWKFVGFAALVAGLAPYKVETNEETGERSYQSLLLRVTSAPGEEDGEKRRIGVNLGEGILTSRLMEKLDKGEETHLFSDEISVEYKPAEEAVEEAAKVEEAAAEVAEEAASEAVEAVEETAVEAVEAAEAAESQEPETEAQ